MLVEIAAFAESAWFGLGIDGFPEGQVDGSDGEAVVRAPLLDGGVELLGDGQGGEIPGVAAVVNIFSVATCGYARGGGDAFVDGVDGAKGVGVGFEIC